MNFAQKAIFTVIYGVGLYVVLGKTADLMVAGAKKLAEKSK